MGERDGAVLALQLFAARAADHGERVAAAVEQDERLFAAVERCLGLLDERAREELFLAGFLKLAAHVDEFHLGQRAVHDALRESSMRVYLPWTEFCQLSSDGVAEPSTTTASASLARITATSRAL